MMHKENRPLAGLGVLVTRPDGQAEGLCRLIEQAGGRALRLPLLEIVPFEGEGADCLRRLSDWDWLIFVSANAVRHGLDRLDGLPEQSSWPKVGAIGPATLEQLEMRAVSVDLVPHQPFNSEALLALPELSEISGQRFLIVRGEGGREHLAEGLRARGAEVAYAEVYRRIFPAVDVDALIACWRKGDIAAVTVTSGQALNHLASLMHDRGRELLVKTPLVVIGTRQQQQALDLGFTRVKVADAGDVAILQALISLTAGAQKYSTNSNYGDTALVDEERELTSVAEPSVEVETDKPGTFGTSDQLPPEVPKKSRLGAWFGYFILFLVMLLAAGGIFLLQELRTKQEGLGSGLDKGDKQMQELLHQISSLQADLAAVHSQIATVQSQMSTEDSKFERQIGEQGTYFTEKLETAKTELANSIQHIQRQMNKTRGDLMIADAEYLLSIANQKLHLVGDVKAVLAAMEGADQRLHDSGDPGVFKVREALAEEINLLKGLNPPDIVGTSAKILALEAKVKDLPLFLPHSDRAKEQHEPARKTQPAAGEKSGNILDSTLEDIKGLVTVRRTDRPVQAILLPEEVAALRQVMLLKLEMARAALLRGDESLFKGNLESAQKWLHEHFDHDAVMTQGVADEISTLQALQIQIALPDIGKSLTLLRNIEKLRLESEAVEGGQKSGGNQVKPEVGDQP